MTEGGYLLLSVGRALAMTAIAVLWTVLLVRVVGLRALSKMTSFDFVATVATGSLIAHVKDMLTNDPVLLMEHGEFLDHALNETRVSRSNLLEKLRSAGVTDLAEVRAVVLERTGDISVIRGDRVDQSLMTGVRRVDAT